MDTTYEHFVHKHTGPALWTRAAQAVLLGEGATSSSEEVSAKALWERFGEGRPGAVGSRTQGIALHPYALFNGQAVRNLYGSTRFGDGYVQWVAQRAQMQRGLVPLVMVTPEEAAAAKAAGLFGAAPPLSPAAFSSRPRFSPACIPPN